VSELDGIGELAQRGLAEVFAAVDADLPAAVGSAAFSERAGLAVSRSEAGDAGAVGCGPARSRLVDRCRLALRAGDGVMVEVDREAVLVDGCLVVGPG